MIYLIIFLLLIAWELIFTVFKIPTYILPSPELIYLAVIHHAALLLKHSCVTFLEILTSIILTIILGVIFAILLTFSKNLQKIIWPVLIVSQSVPLIAMAPLFVLWLGYGLLSKFAIVSLITFFPITANFYQGLIATPQKYLDLAELTHADRLKKLYLIQIPAALPHLANGIRIAVTYAPMGAIVGEWVGSDRGLGFLMLDANAKLESGLFFATLLILIILTLLFYKTIDIILKKLINYSIN